MTRPRLTIAHLMAIVFLLAIASVFAGLARSNDPAFWVGAFLAPVIFVVSGAFATQFADRGRVRGTWIEFALAGWLWVLIEGAVRHQSLGVPLCGVAVAGAALGYFIGAKQG